MSARSNKKELINREGRWLAITEQVFGRFSPLYALRFFIPGFTPWVSLILFPNLLGKLDLTLLIVVPLVLGIILYSFPIDTHYPLKKVWREYNAGFEAKITKTISSDQSNSNINVRSLYDVFFYTKLSLAERNRVHYRVTLYFAYSRIFAASSLVAGAFALAMVSYIFGYFRCPMIINWLNTAFLESEFLLTKLILTCLLNIGIAWITAKHAVSELRGATTFETYLMYHHKEQLEQIFLQVTKAGAT